MATANKLKTVQCRLLMVFVSLFLLSKSSLAQFAKIPVAKIYAQQIKGNRCLDSTWTISNICGLEQSKFTVKFYTAFLDRKQKRIRLVGRVIDVDDTQSVGLTGIEIMQGKNLNNTITGRSYVGETTDGKKIISNDGFFDVVFQGAKGESLFFYGRKYFIEEFRISSLVTQ